MKFYFLFFVIHMGMYLHCSRSWGWGAVNISITCLESSCNGRNQIITIWDYNCFERAIIFDIVLWNQQTRLANWLS